MEYSNPTPTELAAFRRSLGRRRAAVWTVVGVSIGVAALLFARGVAGWWFAVVWGSAAALSVAIWRCPRCGRVLDRNLMARECANCYLRFEGDMP
jgi:threonine/homoserine/homoserine lactone efflux protein